LSRDADVAKRLVFRIAFAKSGQNGRGTERVGEVAMVGRGPIRQAARDLLAKFEGEFSAQHKRIQQLEAARGDAAAQSAQQAHAEAQADARLAELTAANDALRAQLSEARSRVEALSKQQLDAVQLSATNNALQARVDELEAAALAASKVASAHGDGRGAPRGVWHAPIGSQH
jgi:septal ring factor EnvC (AmiA/AmiB activator)